MANEPLKQHFATLGRAKSGRDANLRGETGERHRGDTEIAHLQPGEVVLPPLSTLPAPLTEMLKATLRDLNKRVVGHPNANRNPISGLQAFAATAGDINKHVTAPMAFKTGKHSVSLAYLTDAEKKLLKALDLHGSGAPHPTPYGIPNFDGGGSAGGGDESDGSGSDSAAGGAGDDTFGGPAGSGPNVAGSDVGGAVGSGQGPGPGASPSETSDVQGGGGPSVGDLVDLGLAALSGPAPGPNVAGSDIGGAVGSGGAGGPGAAPSGDVGPADLSDSEVAEINAVPELSTLQKVTLAIVPQFAKPIAKAAMGLPVTQEDKVGAALSFVPGVGTVFGATQTIADIFDLEGDISSFPGDPSNVNPNENTGKTTDTSGGSTQGAAEGDDSEAEVETNTSQSTSGSSGNQPSNQNGGQQTPNASPLSIQDLIDDLLDNSRFEFFKKPERKGSVHLGQALLGFDKLADAASRRRIE